MKLSNDDCLTGSTRRAPVLLGAFLHSLLFLVTVFGQDIQNAELILRRGVAAPASPLSIPEITAAPPSRVLQRAIGERQASADRQMITSLQQSVVQLQRSIADLGRSSAAAVEAVRSSASKAIASADARSNETETNTEADTKATAAAMTVHDTTTVTATLSELQTVTVAGEASTVTMTVTLPIPMPVTVEVPPLPSMLGGGGGGGGGGGAAAGPVSVSVSIVTVTMTLPAPELATMTVTATAAAGGDPNPGFVPQAAQAGVTTAQCAPTMQNGLAIAGLVFGLLSITFWVFFGAIWLIRRQRRPGQPISEDGDSAVEKPPSIAGNGPAARRRDGIKGGVWSAVSAVSRGRLGTRREREHSWVSIDAARGPGNRGDPSIRVMNAERVGGGLPPGVTLKDLPGAAKANRPGGQMI